MNHMKTAKAIFTHTNMSWWFLFSSFFHTHQYELVVLFFFYILLNQQRSREKDSISIYLYLYNMDEKEEAFRIVLGMFSSGRGEPFKDWKKKFTMWK